MKYSIKVICLILIVFGCKESKNGNSSIQTQDSPSISYEDGIKNCEKIRAENPDKYFIYQRDCMVGSQLPSFNATSIDGKTINSEALKGKVTVINFWFTTCPPCIAEIPGLNLIVEKFGKNKVNFISIARNNQQEMEQFLTTHPWSFTHIANEKNIIKEVFNLSFGYPTTFVLNKEAQIIKSFSGGARGEEAITEIQNKLVPTIEAAL